MLEINKVYNMDCLEGIKQIPIPDLIICDPPYEFQSSGRGIVGMRETFNRIKEAELDKFDFDKFIPKILSIQKNRVNAYFFCNKALLPKYLNYAISNKLNYDILTMNKVAPIPTKNSSYLPEIEYIIFLRSKGSYFNGKLSYNKYFKSHKVQTNGVSNFHPTQKPLSIIRKFIELSSKEKDLVLDCFMGSGTTGVASKQLERNFVGFEINKEYCDLSNERTKQPKKWATLKGVCH